MSIEEGESLLLELETAKSNYANKLNNYNTAVDTAATEEKSYTLNYIGNHSCSGRGYVRHGVKDNVTSCFDIASKNKKKYMSYNPKTKKCYTSDNPPHAPWACPNEKQYSLSDNHIMNIEKAQDELKEATSELNLYISKTTENTNMLKKQDYIEGMTNYNTIKPVVTKKYDQWEEIRKHNHKLTQEIVTKKLSVQSNLFKLVTFTVLFFIILFFIIKVASTEYSDRSETIILIITISMVIYYLL